MAPSSMTREAVLSALEEFDSVGRDRFLRKNKYRPSLRYVLVHEGRLYDSKAVIGVAIETMNESPINFPGAERHAASLLETFGFQVLRGMITKCEEPHCWNAATLKAIGYRDNRDPWHMVMCNKCAERFSGATSWPLVVVLKPYTQPLLDALSREEKQEEDDWTTKIGDFLSREERMAKYGGAKYGGIEPSSRTPNVFVYSDPSRGEAFGYNFDGWNEDHSIFFYTGEGRNDDQEMREGNRAIFTHRTQKRKLRLFVADGVIEGTSAKNHRYVGEFEIDTDTPYLTKEAPDEQGKQRIVFVFRLKPVGRILPINSAPSPLVSAVAETRSSLVGIEAHTAKTFQNSGSSPMTATRRESELCSRYTLHLGRSMRRWKITPPGETQPLLTDIYDEHENELYEAKGTSTRDAIRRGIGQLMDYRRHIDVPELKLALLLPHRPTDDLIDLVRGLGIACVYETAEGAFDRIDPVRTSNVSVPGVTLKPVDGRKRNDGVMAHGD